jgi:hypothetical protein
MAISVTLLSSSDLNCFSFNNSTNFINHFSPSVVLQPYRYEVGLAQIEFNTTPEIKTAPTTELVTVPKFFGRSENDNVLTTWTETRSTVVIENKAASVKEFYIHISRKLKSLKIPIELLQNLQPGEGVLKVKLIYNGTDGRKLTISSNLATILGFTATVFERGEYIAAAGLNTDFYNTVPKSETFELVMASSVEKRYVVMEPATRNYLDVISSIKICVQRSKLSIGILESERNLVVNVFDKLLKVRFPPAINEHFKLDTDYIFFQSHTKIPLPAPEPTKISEENLPIPETNRTELVHVMCNFVEPQRIGANMKPILKTICNATNSPCSRTFLPVFYLQPSRTELDCIQISLLDSDFVQLKPTGSPTLVVLHFKRQIL